jgi:hypothetical protein
MRYFWRVLVDMASKINKAALQKQINYAKESQNLGKAAKLQQILDAAQRNNNNISASAAVKAVETPNTPIVSNRNIRQGEINADAINADPSAAASAAVNAAAASPTPQRHFLFHVIYNKSANDANKYTAENVSDDETKLMEVYGMIDRQTDSKKHFIIHVAYDVNTKKYTPTDKSKDSKSAGDIFTQINPNSVRSTVTNRPIANLTEETKRDAEHQHTNLASAFSGNTPTPLSVQRSEDVESFKVGEPTKASKASISTVMPIPNSPKAELLSAVSDASSTNTQGTLKEKLEAAQKKLQNAKTAQLNNSGNTKAKASAVNNASREVKLAENNLAAFNKSKPKSEFNSNGGTRRRKQKKAKTQKRKQRR